MARIKDVEKYEADVPEEVVQAVAEAIVLEAEEQEKTVNITENTTTIVTPSDGYTSIGRLEITTAVPSNVNNQNLTMQFRRITSNYCCKTH